MTYNVFGGTLNPAQSINTPINLRPSICYPCGGGILIGSVALRLTCSTFNT